MPDAVAPSRRARTALERSATTLIEVIGTLAVLLVLGVSAASILGSITDIGAGTNRAKQGRVAMERFAKVFRGDVHDARQVMPTDNHWPLQLSMGATSIHYDWDQRTNSIRRRSSDGEKQLTIDRFQFADRFEPRISVSDQTVTVVLKEGKKTQPWIVEATRR